MCKQPIPQHLKVLLITFIIFCLAWSTATAGNWDQLRLLDDVRLAAEIDRLEAILKNKPEDYETVIGIGIAYHFRAQQDAKKNAPKAVKWLNKARALNVRDAVALCYLGSATTMMATTTWNVLKKSSYANKGIAMMDKAVRKAPDNITVRMTRAHNSKNLPGFLRRGGIALEDFEHLATLIRNRPDLPSELVTEVYTNLVEMYRKKGNKQQAQHYTARLKDLN